MPTCDACGTAMQSQSDWLFRCPKCNLYHSTLTPGSGTGIEGLEDLRCANFELMLDRIEKGRSLSGLRLLEVGSAKGWFLEAATRRGMVARGLEPEEANVRIARTNGLSVESGFFPADLQDRGPYDFIAFNDVFEHLPSPVSAIKQVEELLSADGTVVINLPSSDGTLFRIATVLAAIGFASPLERLWQKGFPSPHIWYFGPKNLVLLVSRHTHLTLDDAFPLPSVTRSGLYDRIHSSHAGPLGKLLFAAVWLLSFALPLLPADIHVAMFKKGPQR
jgi:SAM-dependent methyltransferase